jgi:hypothetical protein
LERRRLAYLHTRHFGGNCACPHSIGEGHAESTELVAQILLNPKWNYAPLILLIIGGMSYAARQLTPIANVLDAGRLGRPAQIEYLKDVNLRLDGNSGHEVLFLNAVSDVPSGTLRIFVDIASGINPFWEPLPGQNMTRIALGQISNLFRGKQINFQLTYDSDPSAPAFSEGPPSRFNINRAVKPFYWGTELNRDKMRDPVASGLSGGCLIFLTDGNSEQQYPFLLLRVNPRDDQPTFFVLQKSVNNICTNVR